MAKKEDIEIRKERNRKAREEAMAKAKRAERTRVILTIVISVVVAVAIGLIVYFSLRPEDAATTSGSNDDSTVSSAPSYLNSAPADQPKYEAVITVKNYGKITMELDPTYAPITVANFVKLAEDGFYDGLTFHRIMEGFMIQGGDPKGNGSGGSDQQIKGEFSQNGVNNPLSHKRGVVSMARASYSMDSASSQFFICHDDSTVLDGQYASFGVVTDGMDVVDKIAEDAEPTDDNGTIPRDQQPVIESITVKPLS